jgi:phage FluMu gp28-like protein
MFDLRTHFLPYQLDWINDQSKLAVGEKSRRIGWTYASAYRAVERRLTHATNLYYTSADLSAAREFIDYCKFWAAAFQEQAEEVKEPFEYDDRTLMLRFPHNDSLILAGSSNPKFFRSKGGDADADEFAFHQDQRGLLKAMQPAGAVWEHQLRIWSTHNGEGSFFNQLVKEGAKARLEDRGWRRAEESSAPSSILHPPSSSSPRWSFHRVTLLDAVAQGLVEKIKGLKEPNATARQDFLEDIRATCPGEDAWNEEYLCRPSTENRSLLPYSLIQSCELPPSSLNPEPPTLNPLYCGFDVGRANDASVLWVVEKVGDVLWTRDVRVLHDMPFRIQEDLVAALLQRRQVKRLCVDSTGMGRHIAENLQERFGHRVEGVHFTQQVKTDLAMPLVRLFQDRQIRIPADADVREDLHKVKKVVTSSNNIRLEAKSDEKGHADRFWALALACHAALDSPSPLPASLARKPLGW